MNSNHIPPISNFIKKRGENTRGGRPKPSKKKKIKKQKTDKRTKEIIKQPPTGI